MKEIKAIIQPFMLDKVLEALHEIAGLPGCTLSQVRGYARSKAHQSGEADLGFAERTKLEIVVADTLVKKVVETVRTSARTGNTGDGKIFIIECADAVHIGTGKHGETGL